MKNVASGKPNLLSPSAKKMKGEKPAYERLYSLGQLQLAKQQQAAALRDLELASRPMSPDASFAFSPRRKAGTAI